MNKIKCSQTFLKINVENYVYILMSCMQKEIMDFLNKVNLVIFTEYMTGMFSIRNRLHVVWRYIQPKFCMHNKDHTLMLACKFMMTSLPCRVYMYTSTICRIISCTCMPTQWDALYSSYIHTCTYSHALSVPHTQTSTCIYVTCACTCNQTCTCRH